MLSDPVGFSFQALEPLAVSIYVAGNVGKPTEHYIARQTSYHGYINAAQRDELAKAVETRHES